MRYDIARAHCAKLPPRMEYDRSTIKITSIGAVEKVNKRYKRIREEGGEKWGGETYHVLLMVRLLVE